VSARIDAVVVAIPAHDEQDLIGASLRSVLAAVEVVRPLVRGLAVCVALDRCTDASAEIARALGVPTVTLRAGAAGAARRAAVAHALARIAERDATLAPRRIWTAHTDADSVVPEHWLAHQLDLAAAGAEVVVGTVEPRFADLHDEQLRAWHATHAPIVANGAVHGANLGIRADTLRRAGGFPAIAVHEDVRLVERAREQGARIVPSDGARVLTSGRSFGRAPDGYARYLREDMLRDPRAVAAG
jgi:glycosyltransferase involved in cell wall biosynthesis